MLRTCIQWKLSRCLGAALTQPPLTGLLQAAVLLQWRKTCLPPLEVHGGCSPWDGSAEPHSVAKGKPLSVSWSEELMKLVRFWFNKYLSVPCCEPGPVANSVPEQPWEVACRLRNLDRLESAAQRLTTYLQLFLRGEISSLLQWVLPSMYQTQEAKDMSKRRWVGGRCEG